MEWALELAPTGGLLVFLAGLAILAPDINRTVEEGSSAPAISRAKAQLGVALMTIGGLVAVIGIVGCLWLYPSIWMVPL
jgi:hypothetical protein